MATRPIVPRGDGEGSLGTSAKKWGSVYTEEINGMDVDNLGGVPVGYVSPFLQSTAPDGWLSCNGAEVSRTAYPDLWAFVNGSSQLISETDWQSKNVAGEKNIGWFSSGDGTTTFRLPRIVGSGELTEVKRFTTAGSGSFTAPVTGIYKITLQGAGGGGGGAGLTDSSNLMYSGGGGGAGGCGEFYEKLTAGQSYSFTIGAGGAGGASRAAGSSGGSSSITIGDNTYVATGGSYGSSAQNSAAPGAGGKFTINDTDYATSIRGESGVASTISTAGLIGGNGGAATGSYVNYGVGGDGGNNFGSTGPLSGGNGGDGYIEFAFNPVPQFWCVRAFGSATNQGTVDITALANMLNDKADLDEVLPLVGGGALTGNNLTWNGADLGGASIAAQSLGSTGYVKYSNGLIVQWIKTNTSSPDGTLPTNHAYKTVNFPISFTAIPWFISATENKLDMFAMAAATSKTSAMISWQVADNNTYDIFVFAIGN